MLKIAEALLDRLGMVLNISKPSLQNWEQETSGFSLPITQVLVLVVCFFRQFNETVLRLWSNCWVLHLSQECGEVKPNYSWTNDAGGLKT
jgi:hypothetical protein